MWPSVELREIRVFLTLAEELHFGRTAERLALTHSRVSQVIRTLEERIGARLVERTSRRVRLIPIGECSSARSHPHTSSSNKATNKSTSSPPAWREHSGSGIYAYVAGGPHLLEIIKTFETRHPNCKVQVADTGLDPDQLDRLCQDQLDLIAMRMPLNDPDLTVGPTLSSEPRVLVVAADHQLAARASVSVEDLPDYTTTDVPGAPREIMDSFSPPRTPSGRPIHRVPLHSIPEAAVRAATGELVHPTVPSFLTSYQHTRADRRADPRPPTRDHSVGMGTNKPQHQGPSLRAHRGRRPSIQNWAHAERGTTDGKLRTTGS